MEQYTQCLTRIIKAERGKKGGRIKVELAAHRCGDELDSRGIYCSHISYKGHRLALRMHRAEKWARQPTRRPQVSCNVLHPIQPGGIGAPVTRQLTRRFKRIPSKENTNNQTK